MRFKQHLEGNYNNWTFPSENTMRADFSEYKKKEKKKWESRAGIIGSRFPIFEDFDHFRTSLKNADIVNLTKSMDMKISNRSHCNSIEDLKDLVSGYVRPRDVDRIKEGFENGDRIPFPIVIKGSRGMWIFSGNTRLNVAFILDIKPKILLVNVI